jgi:hypothetical protein
MKRVYIEPTEKESGSTRLFDSFSLEGKTYLLDYCCAGGVTHMDGDAFQNFVCRIKKKTFKVYYEDGLSNRKYFLLSKK